MNPPFPPRRSADLGKPVEQLYRVFIRRIILYIVSIGSAMTAFLASEGSRRQRKRAQTANHLSATAFRRFETHGYDVVAMEQIAAEADVAKATLYNYFPVTEALLAHRFREDTPAAIA